ncbi:hypothetical protein BD410DRAFT_784139, partial [Rickenella mellea]
MSSDATKPSSTTDATMHSADATHNVDNKGKGKLAQPAEDEAMDEEEEEEEEGDDEDEDEEDDEEEEDDLQEIDPGVIRSTRTRGKRVDYTSAEALKNAGLTREELEKDDEPSFEMEED